MKVILPTKHEVIMTSSSDNNICSILSTNEKAFSWIMNHYIFMWMRESIMYPDVKSISLMPLTLATDMQRDCEYIEQQQFLYDEVFQNASSFVEFAINSINMGWYVIAYLQQESIKCSKLHGIHKGMIIGYDLQTRCFDVEDCFDYGRYVCEKVPFDEIEISYKSVKADNTFKKHFSTEVVVTRVRLIETEKIEKLYKEKGVGTLEYKKEIIYGLSDMYYGQPMHVGQKTYPYQLPVSKNYSYYGVEVHKGLIRHLEELAKNARKIDYRILTTIRDYHMLMQKRVEFLNVQKVITHTSNNMLEKCKKIYKDSVICLNLGIKYNEKMNIETINFLNCKLEEIYVHSKEICMELLDSLLIDVPHQKCEYIYIN